MRVAFRLRTCWVRSLATCRASMMARLRTAVKYGEASRMARDRLATASLRSQPNREASSTTWRGLESTLTSTPGSPFRVPSTRNCVARVVLPVPIWPRMRIAR